MTRQRTLPQEPLYLVTLSHYDRLVDNVIADAQPAAHLSCDWLSDPMALGLMFFPLATYERLRELRNANPGS
ncbi:MAG: hypothetical protein JWO19_4412 [Bryobacterales bacterium]|nr:hypothetical protein [Bryobacterales bacterium]